MGRVAIHFHVNPSVRLLGAKKFGQTYGESRPQIIDSTAENHMTRRLGVGDS